MRKNQENHGSGMVDGTVTILLGSVLGLAVCLLLMTVCSVLMARGLIAEDWTYRVSVVVCFVGALAGGALAVRRIGSRMLVVGLATGVALFLLLLIVGVLMYTGFTPSGGAPGLFLACAAGGAAAGLLGARSRKKRRK